ncbi:hypothetical protein RhiirC2_796203, partial [Rhizophagus irregularis]
SVESFNSIIKKSLNNASSLCDIEEAIDKRHEKEIRYCKLTDIKSLHTTIGLPHLSSQFFSSIDRDLCSNNTIEDNFIEDVVDEPQTILKALLIDMDILKIVETWKICRVGGLSHKDNLVVLFDDGTHLCTCVETITKGIPVLTAIEPPTNNTTLPHEVNFTLQGLRHIQQSGYKENVQQIVSQRNRFGVAFSTAKIAINVALETKSDNELVQLLKDFISSKKNHNGGVRNNENNQDNNEIVPLQQRLIDEVTDPHVTKIRGAPCKKRIKSTVEISNNKRVMREITSEINNNVQNTNKTLRQQRKCLSCGKAGSSTSAASMSSLIAQQPIQTNSNINVELEASMHAQTNESHPGQNTTSKEAKKDDGWTIIKKTQRFSIFISQDSLPGDNIIAKKNFVYRKISDVLGLISLAPTSIKAQAAEICAKKIADDNDVRFAKLEVINNQQHDNLNDYEIKIWDVPLDVDKQMLEVYLKSFGPIKTLKFNVKNLYYEVVVRFNGKQVEEKFKDLWSLRFCKYAFRIFPSNLTKDERNLYFKYGLKLANLPVGTYAADLKDIIIQMKVKSCFVPKNRFSKNYEKERFAFVFFDNENDFNNALGKKFSFNNRGLVFVNYDAVTCHVCSSPYHRVRTCPENQRKRNLSSTHEVYQQIYSRYGVKASRSSMGFRPLFPRNSHYQSDESEGMHNWDEQVEQEMPLQGPSSYAEAAKKIKTVPNSKSITILQRKRKQQETREPVRKPWNQQNINPTPVNNKGDRLDRLERQMEKFMNMIQRLNERVSNLEINHINQAEMLSNRQIDLRFAKDDNTFMNNNNKRVKEFQQTRDVYTEKNVLPNVQTRTLSPMEEDNEVNKTVETEKFIYEPSTVLGTSPSSPSSQEGNTQRLS